MMYDREASGCGMTCHGGGESPGSVSEKTDTLTALKSVVENQCCWANHQGANVNICQYLSLPLANAHDSGLQNGH